MFFWDTGRQWGEAEEGTPNDLSGNCERLFKNIFICFRLHTWRSSVSCLAVFLCYTDLLALVFCYVTVMIGCAWGHARGTGNGTSGRSKAREERSKVKRHCFMLLKQVLTEVSYIKRLLIYLYVYVHLFTYCICLSLFSLLTFFVLFL